MGIKWRSGAHQHCVHRVAVVEEHLNESESSGLNLQPVGLVSVQSTERVQEFNVRFHSCREPGIHDDPHGPIPEMDFSILVAGYDPRWRVIGSPTDGVNIVDLIPSHPSG